jgi:acetyl-CoA carboxylase carboxyltransferase component
LSHFRSPYRSAEVFEIEEVIDPRDSRPTLCRWANLVAPARRAGAMTWTYRP